MRCSRERSLIAVVDSDADRRKLTGGGAIRNPEMASALRESLDRQELALHYRPRAERDSGRIVGVEALSRWRHPVLGDIAPAEFVPLAERVGLIGPLVEWMIRVACTQVRIWRDLGLPSLRVAVNLPSRQCPQRDLAPMVARILAETGLRPDFLELEIAESLIMQEGVIDVLGALKRLGVRLAISDFGAGHADPGYLRRIRLDRIKIDRSFVRDIDAETGEQPIAAAIIAMARSLRLGVIADGVETAAQLAVLRSLRCDEMQGDLFGPPRPAEQLAALLGNCRKLPNFEQISTGQTT